MKKNRHARLLKMLSEKALPKFRCARLSSTCNCIGRSAVRIMNPISANFGIVKLLAFYLLSSLV